MCFLLCSTCLWTLPAYLCSKPISLLVLAPPSILAFCGLFWCSPWFFQLPSHRHWPHSAVRTLLTRPMRSLIQQRKGISIPWEAAQCRFPYPAPILLALGLGGTLTPQCCATLHSPARGALWAAILHPKPGPVPLQISTTMWSLQPIQACLTRHCLHSMWIQPM